MGNRQQKPVDVTGDIQLDADGQPVKISGRGDHFDVRFESIRTAFRFLRTARGADESSGGRFLSLLDTLDLDAQFAVSDQIIAHTMKRAGGKASARSVRIRAIGILRAAIGM